MFNFIKNLFKKKEVVPEYNRDEDERLDFLGEFDGHKLYKYKSVDHMSVFRRLVLQKSHFESTLQITGKDREVYNRLMTQAFDDGKINDAVRLHGYWSNQCSAYSSERVLLHIGNAGILVDDEPHDGIPTKHLLVKEDLLTRYPECRVFFLNFAIAALPSLMDSPPTLSSADLSRDLMRMEIELSWMNSIGEEMYRNI